MNGQIKRYLYIIGTICIVFLLGSIFIRILPWLLFCGLVTYIVMKIVGFFRQTKEQKNSNDFNYSYDKEESQKDSTDDYITGEVIDVEYEDIGDKEN